eukprot:TRINITY_DN63240_c0_g3_i1.p3 TRINITY_DN63240_c0_g3~~TRINITY_DN63240_c0_g3_i1.p3  ORF type:complete len:122 (+),score=9.82 TRINITY_DN63240_c0_g3_i1:726-1091(+)
MVCRLVDNWQENNGISSLMIDTLRKLLNSERDSVVWINRCYDQMVNARWQDTFGIFSSANNSISQMWKCRTVAWVKVYRGVNAANSVQWSVQTIKFTGLSFGQRCNQGSSGSITSPNTEVL